MHAILSVHVCVCVYRGAVYVCIVSVYTLCGGDLGLLYVYVHCVLVYEMHTCMCIGVETREQLQMSLWGSSIPTCLVFGLGVFCFGLVLVFIYLVS